MKQPTLTYIFHNPNTTDDYVNHLIKISAQVAVQSVKAKLLALEDAPEPDVQALEPPCLGQAPIPPAAAKKQSDKRIKQAACR